MKKECKIFKPIKEEEYSDDIFYIEVKCIEIYNPSGKVAKVFDKRDSDKTMGFRQKARLFAKGGKLRIKYIYY